MSTKLKEHIYYFNGDNWNVIQLRNMENEIVDMYDAEGLAQVDLKPGKPTGIRIVASFPEDDAAASGFSDRTKMIRIVKNDGDYYYYVRELTGCIEYSNSEFLAVKCKEEKIDGGFKLILTIEFRGFREPNPMDPLRTKTSVTYEVAFEA